MVMDNVRIGVFLGGFVFVVGEVFDDDWGGLDCWWEFNMGNGGGVLRLLLLLIVWLFVIDFVFFFIGFLEGVGFCD